MPPIELGPTGTPAPRSVGAIDARTASERPVSGQAPRSAAAAPAVVRSAALDAGAAPVDAERVREIRRAIEEDRYPILPMKAADAMIAAGLLLRSGK